MPIPARRPSYPIIVIAAIAIELLLELNPLRRKHSPPSLPRPLRKLIPRPSYIDPTPSIYKETYTLTYTSTLELTYPTEHTRFHL